MMRNRILTGLLVIMMSISSVGPVMAQGTTSRVVGVVTDPTGAVVPDATVTLTNEATKVSFTTRTTAAGTYVFDSVQIGTYTITVEKEGFKKFVSSGNQLTIGQPLTVNATLEVGQIADVVEVSAAAELVQTSTSGNFGNLVEQRAILSLPIVGVRGRNPLDFVLFQPGVVSGANTGGGVHVHGARDRAWNFTLDGIDINETSAGGSNFSPLRTNPDSLAEFRVLTSNFTAEFGRNSGGQVTMVTRSGTNEFHGTLFWFYQTPRLHANSYTNNLNALGKPQFVQHIAGYSVGGPIVKNKTFFFTNLQVLRTRETQAVTSLVYTEQARRGIFRYVRGGRNLPAGVPGASVDARGNVLPGVNVGTYDIAANDPQGLGLDPQIQKLIGLTPLPNNFTVGDGLNIAGFSWTPIQREAQEDFVLKIDHVFNERHTLYGRWAHGRQDTIGDFVNDGWARFPNTPRVVDTNRDPRNLAINWRWNPTPRITNEFVVGMNRFTFNFANPDPNWRTNPPFTLNDVTTPLFNYFGNLRALTTYQLVDNFTYVRGAHTFKTGINFRYQRHIDKRGSVAAFNIQPSVDFSTGVNTVDPVAFKLPSDINTTFDRPALQRTINNLLGRVGNITQSFVAVGDQFAPPGTIFDFDARYPEYDFYWQDTWKVRPNFTFDLGLRWELKLSPRDPRDRIFRPDKPVVLGAGASNTLRWVRGPLFDNDVNNFGPSIGFAWDPFGTGKTSIRANYRLAYDRINTFVLSSVIFQSTPGLTLGVVNQEFGQRGGRIRDGIPVLSPPPGVTPVQLRQPAAFSTTSIHVMDPSWRVPKTNMWGLSIQRELPGQMLLELNYIGRRGVGLFGGYNINQAEIFSNGFLEAFNIVRAGGESDLINRLLQNDSRRRQGETGSQMVRRLFTSTLQLGSVAALAASIATRTEGGRPLVEISGFSPFFFFPFPQFAGGLNVLDSNDFSTYHAFEAQIQRRHRSGLSYQFSYTWSKSLDTRSFDPTFTRVATGALQSASSTPFDIRNRRLNYARSDFDRRHAFQGYWVWELPFGRGRRWGNDWPGVVERILGGWETSGIIIWYSGRPFTVYSGANTVSNVVQSPASCDGCKPDMGRRVMDPTAGTEFYFDLAQIGTAFDSARNRRGIFSVPPPGQLGNLGRNFFDQPAFFTLDMTIAKRTRITETHNVEFRLEMQNALNHPSFGLPNSAIITSSLFARMRGAVVSGPRRMQLVLKYNF
ncbi:MAG TPA: TonB-dependent receptor [Blastocatellia bacterium]|nr:TonB-dependent receptor [Blastocatellia bacterium]